MEIKERKLSGVYEITLKPHLDNRGFFMRTFDASIFSDANINRNWVQENHSCSLSKGIVRGLHFQLPPHSETKMVRCVRGEIIDVFVDIRKNSPTFGQWDSIKLTEENKKMILIPRGFAHGFGTLSEHSEVLYKVDNFYNKEAEHGLMWNDKDLKINWGIEEPTLSEKDSQNLSFEEFVKEYNGLEI